MSASRTATVYQALKEELLEGQLSPGERVPIDQIAQRLGVSPGAVREALSRLTSDRLVIAEPQRGFAAAPISERDLLDLTSVWIEVETTRLRSAIDCGTLAWEGQLLDAWRQLSRIGETLEADPLATNPEWTRLHTRFHDDLLSTCRSRGWLALRDALFLQAERYRRLICRQRAIVRDISAELEEILAATLARDSDRACEAIAQHLRRTATILIASPVSLAGKGACLAPSDKGRANVRIPRLAEVRKKSRLGGAVQWVRKPTPGSCNIPVERDFKTFRF